MKECSSIEFRGSGVVGSKGQVVIPKELRDSKSIKEGDKVLFVETPQKGVFMVMKADVLNDLTEKLQSKLTNLNSLKEAEGNE